MTLVLGHEDHISKLDKELAAANEELRLCWENGPHSTKQLAEANAKIQKLQEELACLKSGNP